MLQAYSINVWGDLAGIALITVIIVGVRLISIKVSYTFLYACLIVSGAESGGMLRRALNAGDTGIFIYHTFWAVLGLAGMVGLWALYLRKPKPSIYQ